VPFQPGDVVDRYVIEALLGAGGMGEVYRARDTRLQRKVALKILRESTEGSNPSAGSRSASTGAARILREARAAAALDHANVVAVFDVGQIEAPGELQGTTFLAMELIKGSSLRAFIGDTRVPIDERLRWLIDVARALAAAHQVGIVHRDIKPENVMIREDGQVKVLDFGIARRAHGPVDPSLSTEEVIPAASATSMTSGTPLYMAPEQLRAEPFDGRADQFGWGVLAYELFTGSRPWSPDLGVLSLVAQVLSATPKPVAEVARDVPAPVSAVVMRALEKDRAARFPSMSELIEALGGRADPRTLPPPPQAADPLAPTQRVSSAPSGAQARHLNEALETAPGSSKTAPQLAEVAPARPRSPRTAIVLAAAAILVAGVAALRLKSRANVAPVAGVAASSSAVSKPECTSNKTCVDMHSGEPWICRPSDHRCVSVASEDCTVLAEPGDPSLDSTVWIGMMLPLTGELGKYFKPPAQAAELARRDFAGTLGRVGSGRHIGLVSCDADANGMRAARHLESDLHVPAVLLGVVDTDKLVELISGVFTPANILTMLSQSPAPALTALPQGPSGRLVWRSVYSVQQLIDTVAAFVAEELEPQWKLKAPGRTTRVAYLLPQDIMLRSLSDRLISVLRFNGKSVLENGDDFRELPMEKESYARTRAELARFRPSIVLEIKRAGFEEVIQPLEEKWPPGEPRPMYAFTYALDPESVAFIAAKADRRRRFFGMDTVATTIANANFVNQYNETFGENVARVDAPNNTYDGFYAIAYAILALGDRPVTGPAIGGAFARLTGPGKTIAVGPQSIFDAYAALRGGATIDLEGAAGHLDLDPATGESTFDITILCAAPPTGTATMMGESGLVYRQRGGGFTGTLGCR
jgi:serine/threonine protein kinase/ABC-type branched-subunit amino acid transport system substrate-binding protein